MHIDEHGYVGVPEGPHAHSRMSRHHDAAAGHPDEAPHHHGADGLTHDHAHVATRQDNVAADTHEGASSYANGAHDGALVGTHDAAQQGLPEHDHDYDGTKDVSLIELSSGLSKLLLAVFWVAFALPILFLQYAGISPGYWLPVLGGRRSRWRPPLRAPPLAV